MAAARPAEAVKVAARPAETVKVAAARPAEAEAVMRW